MASPDLQLPARARKFLRYIVEETLAGRADRIKAYSIGTDVFERDASFDAQGDPVVRIEAGRLRRALDQYYLVSGLADPVVIDVPKGAYIPHFTLRAVREVEAVDPRAPATPSPEAPIALPSRRSNSLWIGLGAAALATAVIGLAWWGTSHRIPPTQASTLTPSGPTLVVMPFASLGDGPETKIYAQGLTEEVLGQLARFKELSVLGRETSQSIPPGADAARIRREFGVRYVLEGSVRTAADQLRVAGRLLDAETGAVLWSQAYDEDLRVRGSFAIQDDVAQKVATAVGQPYGIIFRADEWREQASAPEDLEAYACTLQFYGYRAALSPASHAAIRTCLERAVARYPSYATAWAMLSMLYLDEDRFGFNPRPGSPTATVLMRQVSLEKFPLSHFVSAIIYAQLGMKPEAAEARDRFLQMRPTFFDQWDREVAKRNYGPQDGALLAEGARKAGFPVPDKTAAEEALLSTAPQR
jgi:adenylate cyclase